MSQSGVIGSTASTNSIGLEAEAKYNPMRDLTRSTHSLRNCILELTASYPRRAGCDGREELGICYWWRICKTPMGRIAWDLSISEALKMKETTRLQRSPTFAQR
jgi:hypothetical protein